MVGRLAGRLVICGGRMVTGTTPVQARRKGGCYKTREILNTKVERK